MLFWRENRYCYGLKISEQQVDRLKEGYLQELKDTVRQNIAEIPPNMTLDQD